jgi:hypothetical protein
VIPHLRDVLGDAAYESLAQKGETMTTSAIAAYAFDQIDQARTELNAVSNTRVYFEILGLHALWSNPNSR